MKWQKEFSDRKMKRKNLVLMKTFNGKFIRKI